ncbi:hypothetical protein KAH55_08995 [bacterium]|nr:hypothetical protein [bacterium]
MGTVSAAVSLLLLGTVFIFCAIPTKKKVKVTGHRGFSDKAPENTLAAFDAAIAVGAEYVELDIQETADGRLVVIHDFDLKRTTNGSGKISDLTLSEIQQFDAGSWKDSCYAGETVPEVSAVIDAVKGKLKINIEIKSYSEDSQIVEKLLKLVNEKNFARECFFTSFNWAIIDKVKRLMPSMKAGYLFSEMPDNSIFETNVDLFSVHFQLVTAEFIAKAHAAGKEVHTYTVNEIDEMQRLIDCGVDNIITNCPDKLLQHLAEEK